MALDTHVEGASWEQLESPLRYVVPKTSSAILSSRAATVFPSGGDSCSGANGVRAIVVRIQGSGGAAGGEYLDPSSLFSKALYVSGSSPTSIHNKIAVLLRYHSLTSAQSSTACILY